MSQSTVEDTLSHVLPFNKTQEEEDADKTSSVNSGDLFGCYIPPCSEEESNVPSSTADIQDCHSEDILSDITSPEDKSLLEKDNIKSQSDNDFETFNSKVPLSHSSKSGGESEDCTAINSGNESQVKLNVEERPLCTRSGLIVLKSSQPHPPYQPMKDEVPKEAVIHRLPMSQPGEGIYVKAASPFAKAPMLHVPMDNNVDAMDTPTSDDERFSSVDSNGYARIKDIVDTVELYRLTSEDDLEKASSGYSSEYSSGYARTKDIVDTEHLIRNPNDDPKPLKERPNTSPDFPLPQVPEVPLRPFSEGDADQRMTDLSQDITALPTYKYSLSQSVVMEIAQGDITKETTDVIINSVLPSLDLSKGQVSNAILTAGGNSIQDECLNKFTILKKDKFVVTQPGCLPCKMIIHVLVQDERRDVEDVIKKALHRAEMLKFQSISFPAIGTGGRGLSEEMIAKAMYTACKEFAKSEPKFLKKIRLAVFKEAVFNTIKVQVELKHNKPSKLKQIKKVLSREKKHRV